MEKKLEETEEERVREKMGRRDLRQLPLLRQWEKEIASFLTRGKWKWWLEISNQTDDVTTWLQNLQPGIETLPQSTRQISWHCCKALDICHIVMKLQSGMTLSQNSYHNIATKLQAGIMTLLQNIRKLSPHCCKASAAEALGWHVILGNVGQLAHTVRGVLTNIAWEGDNIAKP